MTRLIASLIIMAALPLALPASEFEGLVREFSRQSGAKQTNIPLFFLARLAVAVVRPAGTSDLKLAIFEHANFSSAAFSKITDSVVGAPWKPMVRVRARRGESTNIYSQADGAKLRLLVVSLDHSDATFVEVRVRPEELMKFVDEHRHEGR
jgi:hypothetical protein